MIKLQYYAYEIKGNKERNAYHNFGYDVSLCQE